jgi:hypothetical protein
VSENSICWHLDLIGVNDRKLCKLRLRSSPYGIAPRVLRACSVEDGIGAGFFVASLLVYFEEELARRVEKGAADSDAPCPRDDSLKLANSRLQFPG